MQVFFSARDSQEVYTNKNLTATSNGALWRYPYLTDVITEAETY